jgi:hypothetical protein
VEAVGFLEALVRALGRGWSARFGMIAPYGVYGVTLTSDVGGSIEIVPSLVRGPAVIWSPFVFTRGVPHYDLHAGDRMLMRTPAVGEAVARLERWRQARGPAGRVAARLARVGSRPRRPGRTTEVDGLAGSASRPPAGSVAKPPAASTAKPPIGPAAKPPAGSASKPLESLAEALRDQKLGKIERAKKLAKQRDLALATRELLAIAKTGDGDARANALGVLAAIARPDHGPAFARFLDDADRSVRSAAIDGIKHTGYAAAIPALAAIVLDRDAKPTSSKTQLATAAADAMQALSGKRGAAALTGYLGAADPRVREAACVALGLSARPSTKLVRPLLEALLTDDDARVVKAARRALAAL